MNEIKQKHQDKIENVKQVSIEKQRKFIGSAKPIKGHTTFEVNYLEKTIEKAVFDSLPAINFIDAQSRELTQTSKKITVKPNCVYITALNKKNVIKILKRDFGIVL